MYITVTVALAAAVATFIGIVRDVWPHLSAEYGYTLKHHFENSTIQQLRARDKAIGKAWRIHVEVFPQSRKRLLFAALVVLTALSGMAYPLWMAFGSRSLSRAAFAFTAASRMHFASLTRGNSPSSAWNSAECTQCQLPHSLTGCFKCAIS